MLRFSFALAGFAVGSQLATRVPHRILRNSLAGVLFLAGSRLVVP